MAQCIYVQHFYAQTESLTIMDQAVVESVTEAIMSALLNTLCQL